MSAKNKRDKLLAAIAAAKALENGVVAPVAVAPVAVAPVRTFKNLVTSTPRVDDIFPHVPTAREYAAMQDANKAVMNAQIQQNKLDNKYAKDQAKEQAKNFSSKNGMGAKSRRKTRRLRKRRHHKR